MVNIDWQTKLCNKSRYHRIWLNSLGIKMERMNTVSDMIQNVIWFTSLRMALAMFCCDFCCANKCAEEARDRAEFDEITIWKLHKI